MPRRRTWTTIPDDGGVRVLWDAERTGCGVREGVRLRTTFCDDPACAWAHVEVAAVRAADETDEPVRSPTPAPTEAVGPTLDLSVEVTSGRIRVHEPLEAGSGHGALLGRLEEHLRAEDGALLELLARRWRHARDETRTGWRERDWSWWEPGDMVAWQEVFPDDPDLLFTSGGDAFLADDRYCISRGCNCRDVLVDFVRLDARQARSWRKVRVRLDRKALENPDDGGPATVCQRRLWNDLVERVPDVVKRLARRRDALRRIAPDLRALAGRPDAEPLSPATRPGRNDPCPCGSGRKYKRCCLGKDEVRR